MKKSSTIALALALAFAGNIAFADGDGADGGDNSMSRWTGESYKAFEDVRTGKSATTLSEALPPKAKDEKIDHARFAKLRRVRKAGDPFRSSEG